MTSTKKPPSEIPPFKYFFTNEDISFITESFADLLRRGEYLTMGRYGSEFESEFATQHGTAHAVAVQSCTAGLEIILRTLDVAGGKVIVPTMTFSATAMSVLRAGAIPMFVDCDDNLGISVSAVEKVLRSGEKVKACVVVHNGGFISPDIFRLVELCREHKIHLVEDAAHAHGSTIKNLKAGSFGVAAAFSFFSTKVMTTGEGGMIVTNDSEILRQARIFRNQGVEVQARDGGRIESIVAQGMNARMSEIHALMGLAQLRRLDEFVEKRQEIAAVYDEFFRDVEGVKRIQVSEKNESASLSNLYKYVLVLDSKVFGERGHVANVRNELKKRFSVTLGGNIYESPCHHQPVFKEYLSSPFPKAESLCVRHICPPIYPQMTREEALYCAQAVREVLQS